ncbi:NAD(P)H-dependent oxidoreductase [Candidatus Kaiserbacteria bacterium]|nr:NAD(P)H-dependent oxidoreductase [Candidatus Kaiserbacteria bacterium]
MQDSQLKIKIILGSTRPNRFSEYPGRWIFDILKKRGDVDAELLDLRDYEMPLFNEAQTPSSKKEPYKNEAVARWTAKVAEGDAYIIVSPEYNRGPSGVIKNALDWVSPEWGRKAVAFVSYGTVGGARAVEALRISAIELQMSPIRLSVNIPEHWNLREADGSLRAGALEPYVRSAEAMVDQLLWWGRALKAARSA